MEADLLGASCVGHHPQAGGRSFWRWDPIGQIVPDLHSEEAVDFTVIRGAGPT